jgi:AhpD family alkylhydroperoxidase
MAVVQLLEDAQAPLIAKPYFADGDPGPIVASMAHVPEMLEVAMPFLSMVFGASSVSLRTKEIVILRASVLQSCRYCTETHTVVARDVGLTLEEVRELRGEASAGAFDDPAELALIAWIDAVAGTTGVPPPQVTTSLEEHYSQAAIVELTMLIGATLMLTRYATSLQLPTNEETLRRLDEDGLARIAASG